MTTYMVQHTLQGKSGDTSDVFVNTFHLDGPVTRDNATLEAIAASVRVFYTAIGQYFSSFAAAPGRHIKIFDLSEAKPRSPIYDVTDGAAPFSGSGQALPNECAIVLSYRALPFSGLKMARRRGRIYLGPLALNTCSAATGSLPAMIETAAIDAILAAAVTLRANFFNVGGEYHWVVLSPTSNTFVPISLFTVDNAFDTQRRRGNRPTTHKTLDAATGAVI